MGKNIFVTGASGFLGRRILEAMLKENNDDFYLLVRSNRSKQDLKEWFNWADICRLHYIDGDITQPHLGIDDSSLSKKINEFWHLAASTDFAELERDAIRTTNIQGTQHVLDLLKTWDNLDHFFYVSTAYISGKNNGIILEDGMPPKNGFKNPYEESKYECELLVRASDLPFTIVRPSILIGDSQTGDARGENRMAYGYLLAIYHAAIHAFGGKDAFWESWLKGKGTQVNARIYTSHEVTKNFVTLDDAVNVCMQIRNAGESIRKTYHVVNGQNITMGRIVELMQHALRISGLQLDPRLKAQNLEKGNLVERALYKYTAPYWPYALNSEPQWQYSNVEQLRARRIPMTEGLFNFLMQQYVERYLRPQ